MVKDKMQLASKYVTLCSASRSQKKKEKITREQNNFVLFPGFLLLLFFAWLILSYFAIPV